jgi:hypothetical protein
MGFRLYHTNHVISAAQYQANKSRFRPMVYSDRDDALRCAGQIIGVDGVPWEIIGDDGSVVGRREIADEIVRRRDELARPPKVY